MMDEQMVKEQENPKTHEDAVTGPPEREKAYSLRRLNATDVFLMVRILGKIRINEWIPCLQSPRVMELIRKIMETEEQDGEKAVQAEESGETAEEKLSNEEFIAGIGVAMGNACPEALQAADYITADIDDDGLAKALRHFGVIE